MVGESATLTCITNHTTEVGWSRSQDPVLSNDRITSNGGILIFHTVLLEDTGIYECSAGNELLVESVEVELIVKRTHVTITCTDCLN